MDPLLLATRCSRRQARIASDWYFGHLKMKTKLARRSALLALGLWVIVGFALFQPSSFAQDNNLSGNETMQLSSMARFEGTWVAKGDGFSSTLQYQWVLPKLLLRAGNELRNDAGEIVGQYEGNYAWDPDLAKIVFWTVGRDGELHKGTAAWHDEKLLHEVTVSGGRTRGYRSVLELVDGESFYRAKYQASATEQEVEDSPPLIYSIARFRRMDLSPGIQRHETRRCANMKCRIGWRGSVPGPASERCC